MGLLITFFLVSICFSFLCSILEAVLLSVTPSYVARKVQEGGLTGQLLALYKEDVDRPLAAILTLNTIAHTLGAIGVGAQAGVIYGSQSLTILGFSLSYEAIVAGVMTLAILIISEIIPKTIGANNWRTLAPFSVRTIRFFIIILYPLVWTSQLITKWLKNDKNKSVLSRADFIAMATAGETEGVLKKNESTIIQNLMQFESKTIREIMTPRTVMYTLNQDISIAEYMDRTDAKSYSRIPIYENSTNAITGLVLKDELLLAFIEGKGTNSIHSVKRDVKFVQSNKKLPHLFQILVKEKQHLLIVNDEFGTVTGLVTMEDVFETLLGHEIVDEMDEVEDLQALAREQWENQKKGMGE